MACPFKVLEVLQVLSMACDRLILVPLGVVWPDVKIYSSASPECVDPLSGKSCMFCVPSTVEGQAELLSKSEACSVGREKETMAVFEG